MAGNVYTIAGAGGNIVASIGGDGVVIVNSGPADAAANVLAEIEAAARTIRPPERPDSASPFASTWQATHAFAEPRIRRILNTNDTPHNVGGNEAIPQSPTFAPFGHQEPRTCHQRDEVAPLPTNLVPWLRTRPREALAGKGHGLPRSESAGNGLWPVLGDCGGSANHAHFRALAPVLADTHETAPALDSGDVHGIQPGIGRDALPGENPVLAGRDRVEAQKPTIVRPTRAVEIRSMPPRLVGNGDDEDPVRRDGRIVDLDRQSAR